MGIRLSMGKSIGACITELVVGILLLIDPFGFTSTVCVLLGIGMIGYSVLSLLQYFRAPTDEAIKNLELSRGLVFAALGLFFIFGNGLLIGILPTLTVMYGILMLILGTVKIQWAVDQLRLKVPRWYISAIDAALTIILAAIIIIDPFATDAILFKFIGISMIVSAVIDIASAFSVKQYL